MLRALGLNPYARDVVTHRMGVVAQGGHLQPRRLVREHSELAIEEIMTEIHEHRAYCI